MDISNIPYFDGHCDTIMCCSGEGRLLRENNGHLDLLRLKKYKKAVQFFAMYFPLAEAPEEGMFSVCKRQQNVFETEVSDNRDIVVQCRNANGIKKAHEEGKIAAVLSCEGPELINCDINNLEWAHKVGIKAMNITWNHANLISGSHKHEPDRGLSGYGKAFVKKAQNSKILMDVSHCSDKAFWDLASITTLPIIATHSNSREVCNHTRNLTDDMFKEIMKTNGVAGINFWIKFVAPVEDPTMEDIIKHVDHFMELGGAKNIALGADLDGCAKLAGGMTGVQDMPMLWDALSKHGFSDSELEDIFFNNFMRVMESL